MPESEIAAYAHTGLEATGIPDSISGVSAVRNWIIARFPEECLVMMDDDISAAMCMVSLKVRKLSVEEAAQMVENTAYCARGAGARCSAGISAAIPACSSATIPSVSITGWEERLE